MKYFKNYDWNSFWNMLALLLTGAYSSSLWKTYEELTIFAVLGIYIIVFLVSPLNKKIFKMDKKVLIRQKLQKEVKR